MQTIHLSASNKKTMLPVFMTLIQTLSVWLIPTVYSRQVSTAIQHTFNNQFLLILFIFMFNFLVFDRLTNKISVPIFLSMVGISVLIAALSFSKVSPTISLLLFTCLLTLITFFLPFKTNWPGLILFTLSTSFILPESLFYIQCGFLSKSFLTSLLVPTLGTLFFFFPFFSNRFVHKEIYRLIIGLTVVLTFLFIGITSHTLLACILLLVSWLSGVFFNQIKLDLLINIFLNLLFSMLLIL